MPPVFESDSYKGQFTDRPSAKFPVGTTAAEVKTLSDKISFTNAAPLLNGDIIEGPKIPAGAKILSAKLNIKTPGATTGIVQFGHKASEDGSEAQDATGLVPLGDAGGQNVNERDGANSGAIFKRFTSPAQLLLTCTENFDDACDIEFQIEYSNT